MASNSNEDNRPAAHSKLRGFGIATGTCVGGFAAAAAIFRNADSTTKILAAVSKLTEGQAGLLVALAIFAALLWLVVRLVNDAVGRREAEITTFREVAGKWEAMIAGDLKEIKGLMQKKGGK